MINETDLLAFAYWTPEDEDWTKAIDTYPSPMEYSEAYSTLSGQTPDPKLYCKLIDEEHHEWQAEAVFEVDKPHDELKELADLVYVIYGYAYAKGWNLDEALKRVHENNVARMTQDDGTIKRREDGKIIKNPNTPKVKLHDLV
jgi:predicted HAD superfamily Cof-like phosphohydrolase